MELSIGTGAGFIPQFGRGGVEFPLKLSAKMRDVVEANIERNFRDILAVRLLIKELQPGAVKPLIKNKLARSCVFSTEDVVQVARTNAKFVSDEFRAEFLIGEVTENKFLYLDHHGCLDRLHVDVFGFIPMFSRNR